MSEFQPCLLCGGNADEPGHLARCGGPGGYQPYPPSSGITADTLSASKSAADQIEPNAETLRALVLAYIRRCGLAGATDDEIQAALGMEGNTERPRRWELYKVDLIKTVGFRENERGRRCTVWVAT